MELLQIYVIFLEKSHLHYKIFRIIKQEIAYKLNNNF